MNPRFARLGLAILIAAVCIVTIGLLVQVPVVAGEVGRADEDSFGREATTGDGVVPATLPYTTCVVATIGQPQSLDPHWMYDTASSGVAMQIYETLVFPEREKTDTVVPLLASGWEISPDGRTYTFTIRSGVSFHQGGELTAQDVAYSFWRGMLQDRGGGPMWMLLDALLAVRDVDELPGDDLAKCQMVKSAATYDAASARVTFHLAAPFGPFLQMLTNSSASILDREWMAANGDWGSDCSNWRNCHDPAQEGSVLYNRANGTGPFALKHWGDSEVALERNDRYWITEPLWDRGPAGPPALHQVIIREVLDWPARYEGLVSGEFDLAYVPRSDAEELDPLILARYDGPSDETATLVHPTGTLRLVTGLPSVSATDLAFNYSIVTDTNAYIGSGTLDGQGIPPDFFSDLDVRKAFNYAFDWTTYINDALGGEAIQRRGPIIAGMLGYDDGQPTYFFSPTLSAYHFQQAWGGQVWTNGFSLTLAYNTGNNARQRVCEILKQSVEALNPAFQINIISLEWSEFLSAYQTGRLPIRTIGWLEDYHHPNNWVVPYLSGDGTYGQELPATLTVAFDAKIAECKAITAAAAAHACYAELQNMAYENATHIFLTQSTSGRHYERAEVRGWYHNPGFPGQYFYALSKGPLPTLNTVTVASPSSATYSMTSGLTMTFEIPAGGVTQTTVIVYTPDLHVAERPGGMMLAGQTFALEAYQEDEYVPGFAFNDTATLTLHYEEGLLEDTLILYTWDGSTWVDAACGPYLRDTANNLLTVPICHLSDFVLFVEPRRIFVPLMMRGH